MSVADGILYSAEAGRIQSIDAETGEVRDATDIEGIPTGSPAIANGRLYVGTDAGKLYAIGEGRTGPFEPALGVGGGLAALGGYALYRRTRTDSPE